MEQKYKAAYIWPFLYLSFKFFVWGVHNTYSEAVIRNDIFVLRFLPLLSYSTYIYLYLVI